MFYIQYSGWGITHTPHECAGLARVFAIWGLDKFWGGLGFAHVKDNSRFPSGMATRNALARHRKCNNGDNLRQANAAANFHFAAEL